MEIPAITFTKFRTAQEKNAYIKSLYKSVNDKTAFTKQIAAHFDKNYRTIANNWFIKDFNVPIENQDKVIEDLESTISKQIELLNSLLNNNTKNIQ